MKNKKRKDFEIRFYEEIVKERPDFVPALISLGNAYTKRGFYKEGLEIDKKLVQLRPNDPIAHYNLACSLSLVGEYEEAFKELKKAIFLGYDEIDYIFEDKDLENLRTHPQYKEFFLKLKKIKTSSFDVK